MTDSLSGGCSALVAFVVPRMNLRAALAALVSCLLLNPALAQGDPSSSVVKVFATVRAPDFFRPWSKQPPQTSTGTGFVFESGRIITNAHVIEHASRVLVQAANSSDRVAATVEFASPLVDLAVLRIDEADPSAATVMNLPPLGLSDELPAAGDPVSVLGYPLDGDQVSVTEGVVSRVSLQTINGPESGLVVQIDAAVNPGNSGGPVLSDGRVAGVVFGRRSEADGVAYALPIREVREFLDDVSDDGEYGGFPYIRARYWPLRNRHLRRYLGVPQEISGVVVGDDDLPDMGDLRPWDLITGIGEYDIDAGGNISIGPDLLVNFEYAVHEYRQGDEVTLRVWRDGAEIEASVPVVSGWLGLADYPIPSDLSYFIHGPVVFLQCYLGFVNENNSFALALNQSPLLHRVLDKPTSTQNGQESFVVALSPFLTHPVTQGYDDPDLWTVDAINGVKIQNLGHLVETLRDLDDEWLVIDWAETGAPSTVLPAGEMERITEEILDENGIRRRMSRDMSEHWR